MRPEEVLASRYEYIQRRTNALYIPKAKGGDRLQYITAELAALLRQLEDAHVQATGDETGWIFPSTKSSSGHRVRVNAMFRRCVTAAGLDPDKVTPYTIKRTNITDVAETGIDLAGLMAFSGHKTAVCALRYCHPREKPIRKALQVLEASSRERSSKSREE